jgi:Mg2+ and Co2+ transporter CorA
MCIRCGQVVSSTPDKLAEAMEPHFTDKLKFGCPHFESRRPNVSIAFFDHGLDDALFHCQRQLRHAQKQLSDQESVALTLSTQAERLTEQLRDANDRAREVGELRKSGVSLRTQLDDARRRAEELLAEKEELERKEGGGSEAALEAALKAVAQSDVKRARKLRAALHPDGLPLELHAGANRVRHLVGL